MQGFGRELFRRRVPQIVGAYLAGGWILLEFTDWTVNRYVLSPHLTDFVVASWLLLLPAVAMLAWNHGSPGRDVFSRGELIGVVLNLVVAVGVLAAVFRGRDLGAATSSVEVLDEQGRTVTRSVPKPEYRRRVALFPMRNGSGDPELDWLQFGLPAAVAIDLRQDAFVTGLLPRGRELENGDPDRPLLFPLARQRELAAERGAGSFVAGTLNRVTGGLEARVTIYSTRTGVPVEERILSAPDALSLADAISVALRRDVGVPAGHIEGTADLPVREILSDDERATKSFFAGLFLADQDAARSLAAFEEAVARDSTFARAQLRVGDQRLKANDGGRALAAFEAAIRHEYRLEESSRFGLKTLYFNASQQPDKAVRAARMRTELFPEDSEGHWMLGSLLMRGGDTEGALAALETALATDPANSDLLLTIGNVYREDNRPDEAARRFREYAERNPDSRVAEIVLGELFLGEGQLDSATAHFQRAELIDPSSPDPLGQQAIVALYRGRPGDAEPQLEAAGRRAATDRERLDVLRRLRLARELAGRSEEAVRLGLESAEIQTRLDGPATGEQIRGYVAASAARGGRDAEARTLLDGMAAVLQPPYDDFVGLAEALAARERDDAATIRRNVPTVRRLLEDAGLSRFDWLVSFLEAEAARIEGDCEEAAVRIEDAVASVARASLFEFNREFGIDPLTARASCLRKLGRLDEAGDLLAEVLRRVPGEPNARVEAARLAAARGDRDGALRELDAALATWRDADPGYRPAIAARALREELAGG